MAITTYPQAYVDGAFVSPAQSATYDPRTLVIGDSHLQMGWTNNSGNLSAFTVSAGVASLSISNHNIAQGNKFTLIDTANSATLDTCVMSYAEVTALTVPTNGTLTASATVAGVTMADGSYTSGRTWLAIPWQNQRDSSFLHSINGWNGAPFVFTHNFTASGTSSAQHLAALPKLQSQAPKSTYANVVISLGTNSSMYQQATLATAIAAAETEYKNIMAIADALYSSGTVYIAVPIGATNFGTNTSGQFANFTRAVGYLRRKLFQTRRAYRLRFFDLFGLSVDGTDANGLVVANYQGAQNHLSTYANYRIAKAETSWDSRLGWDTANRYAWKPMSYLDDNTNAVTLWAASTAYTVGVVRMNNYTVYQCTVAGTSASSGGPTGDGSSITDGTATWQSLGPAAVNLVQNGLMQGTTGTNNASGAGITGTVPTGWFILGSPTNVTSGTTTGNATISVKPTGIDSTPGFGWDLSIVFSAANGMVQLYQNCPLMAKGGNWYQARMTVTGKTSLNTVLGAVALRCQPTFTGVGTFNVSAMSTGNNTTTIPLDTTDSYEVVTPPFFVPPSLSTSTDNQIYIEISSATAGTFPGTVNLQLSNLAYYPVRDPNIPPSTY